MDTCVLDAVTWAEANFGGCDFGDMRISKRLVKYAQSVAVRPNESTPQQAQHWKDCKGAYRFMSNKKVTYQEIIRPHCERTRERAESGVWLSICDTTELSFAVRRQISGLKSVGTGIGQGFFLHSSILVSDETGEIAGLAAQQLYYRIDAPKGESTAQRKKRRRESEVWGRVVDQIGPPQNEVEIIHVCDRGADDYELFCHCIQNGTGWVIRAKHKKRKIHIVTELDIDSPEKKEKYSLESILDTLPSLGTYELTVKENRKQPGRVAKVEVRCTDIWMPRPTSNSKWVKKHGPKFIRMGVVEVREINARKGVTPLRWILYTHQTVKTFEDGWITIGRYEKRPIVEDYHKAAKTGAQIENRLYRNNKRLERVVGVLAVMAARILSMRTVAQVEPNRPAREVAPRKWVTMLCRIQRRQFPKKKEFRNPRTITSRDFIRGVAMLGGFLARKCDGEPGWITIWRGVKELLIAINATRRFRAQKTHETCG